MEIAFQSKSPRLLGREDAEAKEEKSEKEQERGKGWQEGEKSKDKFYKNRPGERAIVVLEIHR